MKGNIPIKDRLAAIDAACKKDELEGFLPSSSTSDTSEEEGPKFKVFYKNIEMPEIRPIFIFNNMKEGSLITPISKIPFEGNFYLRLDSTNRGRNSIRFEIQPFKAYSPFSVNCGISKENYNRISKYMIKVKKQPGNRFLVLKKIYKVDEVKIRRESKMIEISEEKTPERNAVQPPTPLAPKKQPLKFTLPSRPISYMALSPEKTTPPRKDRPEDNLFEDAIAKKMDEMRSNRYENIVSDVMKDPSVLEAIQTEAENRLKEEIKARILKTSS